MARRARDQASGQVLVFLGRTDPTLGTQEDLVKVGGLLLRPISQFGYICLVCTWIPVDPQVSVLTGVVHPHPTSPINRVPEHLADELGVPVPCAVTQYPRSRYRALVHRAHNAR